MPLYDFGCDSCGGSVELSVPMAERDEEQRCECGAVLNRLISGGGFILIGGGWTGRSHVRIIPPNSDRSGMDGVDKDGYHTNYYNCTPESVHRT